MKELERIVLGILLLVAASLAVCGAAQSGQTGLPSVDAPCGRYIPDVLLDGTIGSEWDDAAAYDVEMGSYDARLYLKHDEVYFYVAMHIQTNRPFFYGFEAYVVFENGDGADYSQGDDMMSVPAQDGELLPADWTYRATYSFLEDEAHGGTCDAVGAGRYDNVSRAYVFEFRRAMSSGDPCDVPIAEEVRSDVIYGWASY